MSANAHPTEKPKGRQAAVDPPIGAAWKQALAGIRVRFGRHALTALGIALGTAFFASVLTLRVSETSSGPTSAAENSRLTWLALTSLLMCLVGVTNSMLLSISERIREIGTFKCIGASDTFIVKVFFLEAALLGIIGSTAGSVFGTLLMGLALLWMGYVVPFAMLPSQIGVALSVGVVLTVLSAIGPAIHAARLPAVVALRTEV